MSSPGVLNRKLHQLIDHEGFEALVPCLRCTRLNHVCVRSDRSKLCSCCVRAGRGTKCEMPSQSFTDAEWRRLLKSQTALRKQEEELLDAQAEIIAKLMRIRKQDKLLRKRAGDFIARECKEISELEDLERREKEELEYLEKERVE